MPTIGNPFQILESKKKYVSPDMKVNMVTYIHANKNHVERDKGVVIDYMATTTDSRESRKSIKACIAYKFNERHFILNGQPPR